jgi:hypothetical protein
VNKATLKKIGLAYGAWAIGVYAYNQWVVPATQGTTLQLPWYLDPIGAAMPYAQVFVGPAVTAPS